MIRKLPQVKQYDDFKADRKRLPHSQLSPVPAKYALASSRVALAGRRDVAGVGRRGQAAFLD